MSQEGVNEWKREVYGKMRELTKLWRRDNYVAKVREIKKRVEHIMLIQAKKPKIFNRMFSWKKQQAGPSFPQKLLLEDNITITDSLQIENIMKEYWEKAFNESTHVNYSLANSPWFHTPLITKWRTHLKDASTLVEDITLSEVREAMHGLGRCKAPGPDELPLEAWLYADESIHIYLTKIYSKSLKEGIIPEEWKTSKIFLIHKGGKEIPNNYRPISLLNSIYKIFVAILNKRINSVILKNDLLPEHQSGFQKGRSTASRIWALISLIKHQKSKDENIHLLYLDIKKAYDSVNHEQMLETLTILGFPNQLIKIIKNIYKDSIGSIITPNGVTEPFIISKGVKQGCPLSPTLFAIFVEPLLSWLEESNLGIKIQERYYTIGGFADDLVVTTSSYENLVRAMEMINTYMNSYNMELNIDSNGRNKTVHTALKFEGGLSYYDLNGMHIEIPYLTASESYQYLGINLNLELNWEPQINRLWNSFQKQIIFLSNRCLTVKQVIKILNQVTLPALYYSLNFFNISS